MALHGSACTLCIPHNLFHPNTSQGTLNVYSILNPFFKIDPKAAVRQLSQYVQHHAQLGLNATILYERGMYLRHLQEDDDTSLFMDRGNLKVL